MRCPRYFLFAAALTLVTACAAAPIEPSLYLLRSDSGASTRAMVPSRYTMGAVIVAPYLDRSGLLLETAKGQIRPARNHLWAEPLQDGVRNLLTTEISRALGEDILPLVRASEGPSINVRIDQLHGTVNGEVKLAAFWSIAEQGQLSSAHQFSQTLVLTEDGYAALAAAEKTLLISFAASIAKQLK